MGRPDARFQYKIHQKRLLNNLKSSDFISMHYFVSVTFSLYSPLTYSDATAQSSSAMVWLATVLANYGSVAGPSHQEPLGPAMKLLLAVLSHGSTPKKGNN